MRGIEWEKEDQWNDERERMKGSESVSGIIKEGENERE